MSSEIDKDIDTMITQLFHYYKRSKKNPKDAR